MRDKLWLCQIKKLLNQLKVTHKTHVVDVHAKIQSNSHIVSSCSLSPDFRCQGTLGAFISIFCPLQNNRIAEELFKNCSEYLVYYFDEI